MTCQGVRGAVSRTAHRSGVVAGVLAFTALVSISAAPVALASAPVASSLSYYGPLAGYSYKNANLMFDYYVNNCCTTAMARTTVARDGAGNIPAGYMGAAVKAYRSNGALCFSHNSYSYNYIPQDSFYDEEGTYCGAGYFFTQGFTQSWNGNGYNSYGTFRTPNFYTSY